MLFSHLFTFLLLLSTQLTHAQDILIDRDAENVSDKIKMEVIAHDQNNQPVLASATNIETGEVQIIGLGENNFVARRNLLNHLEVDTTYLRQDIINNRMTLRLVAALRLKFADLAGIRIGVQLGDHVELGFDGGTSIYVTHLGGYVNVHPFGHKENALRNLYVSGRFYKTTLFAILAVAQTYSSEGVLGYTFDRKPGGLYSFVEAGVNVIARDYNAQGLGGQTQGQMDRSIILPVIGVGFGWRINLIKPAR